MEAKQPIETTDKENSEALYSLEEIDVVYGTPEYAETIADFSIAMGIETEGKISVRENIIKAIFDTCSIFSENKQKMYGFYLIAFTPEKKPIGCLFVSLEMNAPLGGLIYMIQDVYVVKQYRKKGVFKKIFQKAHDIAKEDEYCKGMRLYVDFENYRAQSVYKKLGMYDTGFLFYEDDFVTFSNV